MTADRPHRSAEEIGRTAAGPRPLPPLGPTREVPLPDVVERTLPTGCGCSPPAGPRCRWSSCGCGCRSPAHETADAAIRAVRRAAVVHAAHRHRDPGPGGDRRRAGRGRRRSRRERRPGAAAIGGSGLAAGLADGARRARRRAHRAPPTRTPRWPGSASGWSSGSPWPARSRARSPGRRCSASGSATTRSPGRCRPRPEVAAVTAEQVRALQAAGAGAARRDPDPRRRHRPGTTAIALVEQRLGRLDGRARRPASCPRRRRSAPSTWSWCTGAGSVQSQLRLSAPALPRLDSRLRRAAAGQPGVRRLLLLALDGEHPRGQGLHLRRALGHRVRPRRRGAVGGDRRGQRRHRRRAAGDPLRAGPDDRRAADGRRDRRRPRLRRRLAADLAGQPGRARLHARRRWPRTGCRCSGCATTRRGWRRSRWTRWRRRRWEFFAPVAFTGVIVGDAEVVGPGLRALGGVDLP